MDRSEIDKDGIWEISAERYKTKRPHALPLSKAMLALIEEQPEGEYVFPSRDGTPFSGFAKSKATLERPSRPLYERLPSPARRSNPCPTVFA